MRVNINTQSRQDYETPDHIFKQIQKTLGLKFTLDLCANKQNTKCDMYISENIDLFHIDLYKLSDLCNRDLWMNPPYRRNSKSEKGVADFLYKADEIRTRCKSNVAVLVSSNITSTKFFADIVGVTEEERRMNDIELYFVKGRVRFLLDKKECNTNPLASMIVLFRRRSRT